MKRRAEEAQARKLERQKQKALAASKWSINTQLEEDIPYLKKLYYQFNRFTCHTYTSDPSEMDYGRLSFKGFNTKLEV